jgi:hypothetical protein
MPYDSARDFMPLTLIGVSPQIMFLYAGSPAKSFKDFIALAKAKPGEVTASHTGIGSFTHLTLELLQSRTGAKFNQVQLQRRSARHDRTRGRPGATRHFYARERGGHAADRPRYAGRNHG